MHANEEEEGLYKDIVKADPFQREKIVTLTRDHVLMRRIAEEIRTMLAAGHVSRSALSHFEAMILIDLLHNRDEELLVASLGACDEKHTPEVIAEARKAGINDAWLESAKDSPVYKLAMKWKIALPLHPEYRTLPMVWYVPPLSPIMNHIEESNLQRDHYIPAVEQMRIPMEYLASLLTAGDTGVIRRVLLKMAAMRVHMRQLTVGGMDELSHSRLLQEADMTADEIEEMARLLAVAKYNERFVIPTGRRDMHDDLFYRYGSCSLEDIAPPEGLLTYPFAKGE